MTRRNCGQDLNAEPIHIRLGVPVISALGCLDLQSTQPLTAIPVRCVARSDIFGGHGYPHATSERLQVPTARAHGFRPGSPLSKAEVQGYPPSAATRGRPSDLSFEFQRARGCQGGLTVCLQRERVPVARKRGWRVTNTITSFIQKVSRAEMCQLRRHLHAFDRYG